MKVKKKQVVAIGALAALITLVGGTITYSQDRSIINNLFGLGTYKTVSYEEFVSPENWSACQEEPKILKVRNDGNVDVAVRISYEEYWRNKTDTGDNLPLTKDGVTLAEILFQNEDDWELDDGYYYYKATLEPGDETSSLFEKVRLNCNANFGVDNVCATEEGTTTCTKPEDDYEGAKYHLKITVETIQDDAKDEWRPSSYVADCDSNKLYDKIACQSKGLDTNIDFTANNADQQGVYTLSAHANDVMPVYYFRGNKNNTTEGSKVNNNVVFNGYCWLAIRTTTTGGVKLIYNGTPNASGACTASGDSTMAGTSIFNNPPLAYDPAITVPNGDALELSSQLNQIGYMQGETFDMANVEDYGPEYDYYYYGTDVSYDSDTGKYTLIKPRLHDDYETYLLIAESHHYTCGNNQGTTCSIVYYVSEGSNYSGSHNVFFLSGGDTVESLKAKAFANTTNSAIKTNLENWFATNNIDSSKLEDTPFCYDRTITTGTLAGNDSNASVFEDPDTGYTYDDTPNAPYDYDRWSGTGFISRQRNYYKNSNGNYAPSVDCSNTHDSFSVSSANGNGKNASPVGLLTADEATLAGTNRAGNSNNTYLSNGKNYWLGTPFSWYSYVNAGGWSLGNENGSYVASITQYGHLDQNGAEDELGLRPVVSLKKGITFTSGNGEQGTPYVIE